MGRVQDAGDQEYQVFPMGLAGQGLAVRTIPLPCHGAGKDEDRDEIDTWGWAEIKHNLCQVFQEIEVSMKLN